MKKETFPINNNIISDVAAQALEVLYYWNSLPYFTAHRDPAKKNYNMALWCIKVLLEGKAGEKMPFDEDFAGDNSIANFELCHKFTVEEIKEAIDKYSFMYSPEYVADKSKWSRALDYFIYNPTTKRSFFWTLTGGREIPGSPIKALDQRIVDMYCQSLFFTRMNAESVNKLVRAVNYVVMQQRAFTERVGQHCYWHPLKDDRFYKKHIQYIELNYQDRDDFRIDHLGPMTYQGFPVWLKEFHNIDINPSNAEIAAMKAKFEVNTVKIVENVKKEAELLLERENWRKNRPVRTRTSTTMVYDLKPHTELLVKPESL